MSEKKERDVTVATGGPRVTITFTPTSQPAGYFGPPLVPDGFYMAPGWAPTTVQSCTARVENNDYCPERAWWHQPATPRATCSGHAVEMGALVHVDTASRHDEGKR